MNKWEDVLTLMKVADRARMWPQLSKLHDTALALLGAIDPNALTFYSQQDNMPALEPLEEEHG